MPRQVQVVEVAPRDGFQAIAKFIDTKRKLELIGALYNAGLRRIEVTSFVSEIALPQMADANEVISEALRLPGLDASVLVPSQRHAERALKAGAKHLVFVLSVSEKHNRSNVNRSPNESTIEYARLVSGLTKETKLRLNIATAFDCPMAGSVEPLSVIDLLSQLIPHAPQAEIALCDTTGRAAPSQVRELFRLAKERFPAVKNWAFHGHDTYGLGTANVFAAYEAGVAVIHASAAGLGGCPFAPGATGNVASEDVVWMMQQMGVDTGVDLPRLCAAAQRLVELPGAQTGGRVRQALEARAKRASL